MCVTCPLIGSSLLQLSIGIDQSPRSSACFYYIRILSSIIKRGSQGRMASACLTLDLEVQSRRRHSLLWGTGWLYLLFNPANLDKKERAWWSGVSHTRLTPWGRTGFNPWPRLCASCTSGKSSSWEAQWQSILAVDSVWRLPSCSFTPLLWTDQHREVLKLCPGRGALEISLLSFKKTTTTLSPRWEGYAQWRHLCHRRTRVGMACYNADTVWPKSCELKCLAFLLSHLGFQGLCTWVQFFFVLCQYGNSFLFHFQVVFTWHFKFLCFSW